jgi:cytidylate kinase
MAVITISRQYGSGGDEIAEQLCKRLGYRYFDKGLIARSANEIGLTETEIVDFSEDKYQVRSFLDRLLGRSRVVAQARHWKEEPGGTRTLEVEKLDEAWCIKLIRGAIHAAYKQDNIVIMGRGGQAILREMPNAFHVRIEAPLEDRVKRIAQAENMDAEVARAVVNSHDKTTIDYLKRFYQIDWSDAQLYHLEINTGRVNVEAAVDIITYAVERLLPVGEKQPVAPG